ncbi:hypothetical protein DE146DRAFT_447115 [Phaeosphaeria sp. MPI-PUGE-AT-0046c]|nr:hypothetical protein DE146DRAFT_447115 [Phaeosphaeria sp. MPI-PUGE-AT-0046c]
MESGCSKRSPRNPATEIHANDAVCRYLSESNHNGTEKDLSSPQCYTPNRAAFLQRPRAILDSLEFEDYLITFLRRYQAAVPAVLKWRNPPVRVSPLGRLFPKALRVTRVGVKCVKAAVMVQGCRIEVVRGECREIQARQRTMRCGAILTSAIISLNARQLSHNLQLLHPSSSQHPHPVAFLSKISTSFLLFICIYSYPLRLLLEATTYRSGKSRS